MLIVIALLLLILVLAYPPARELLIGMISIGIRLAVVAGVIIIIGAVVLVVMGVLP